MWATKVDFEAPTEAKERIDPEESIRQVLLTAEVFWKSFY